MDIKEIIPVLLQIQELDIEINSLEVSSSELKNEIIIKKEQIEKEKLNLLALEQKFRQITLQKKQEEGDAEEKNDLIKKYQQQLTQVKTNKEYTVIQQQIAGVKADCSLIEEKILKTLYNMDEIEKSIQEEKTRLDKLTLNFQQDQKVIDEKIRNIQDKIAHLRSEKQIKSKDVSEDIFLVYNKVMSAGVVPAVVAITGNTCGGCSMSIPAQAAIEVKLSRSISVCPNCSRIIYGSV